MPQRSLALERASGHDAYMGRGDYAGAAGRVKLEQIPCMERARNWAWQQKVDGAYAVLELDGSGCVAQVLNRRGQPLSGDEARSLIGERVGQPWSVLVGELEAHTEAGRRARMHNPSQLARCHLFDAVQVGRERVAELPAAQRRDRLYRAWAWAWDGHEPTQSRDRTRRVHGTDGRFERERIEGVCRTPIVRQWRRFEDAWDAVSREDGEGLVAVRLDAPLGRRGAKKKYKAAHDIDVVVTAVSERVCSVFWAAANQPFTVSCCGRSLGVGQVWKVKHEGFYESGIPRFPRLVEERIAP